MDTILTIISAVLAIGALILCISTWRALRPVSKPQPRTGANLSPLERRREALELATKAWLYSVEYGLTTVERYEREVMERLEREVAAMENERFADAEEATPKPKAPKHVTTVISEHDKAWGQHYRARCSACEWSWSSYSDRTATEKSVEHERKHA